MSRVRRLVDDVVTDYDDRSLTFSCRRWPIRASAARSVYDARCNATSAILRSKKYGISERLTVGWASGQSSPRPVLRVLCVLV